MIPYADINNDSWVEAYENWSDYIKVKFKTNSSIYTYTHSSAGEAHVENMKTLAQAWDWLQAYINTNKPGFC